MKHIRKNSQNEPNALRRFRIETPHPTYKGYGDNDTVIGEKQPLKKALLKEQGYLCAYCMGRISLDLNKDNKPQTEVEHFESQELRPDLSVVYRNMLGVCNGASITYPEQERLHHCDKTKGREGKMNGQVQLKKLDPRSANCEKRVKYDLMGKIIAVNNDALVEHDLNKVLNLNNKALQNARKIVLDNAKNKMIKEKPTQHWDKAFLQKHLEEWRTMENAHFRRYCMIVVWFLKELMNKPHYNR